MLKLVVFVPVTHEKQVREALATAGAGRFDNYDSCFFVSSGKGFFRPLIGAKPYIGSIGEIACVDEMRIETVVVEEDIKTVLTALRESHPYEEIAFDVFEVRNEDYLHLMKK